MSEGEGSETVPDGAIERLPPDEAFSLLADDVRFDIIRTLNRSDGPLPFNELYSRVDVSGSGRFNYHLQKLTDQFVRQEADGYQITVAGHRVIGAVLSGAYTTRVAADPVRLEGACLDCGGPLRTDFEADHVQITCQDCGLNMGAPETPPGALEGWGRDEVASVIDHWIKRMQMSTELGLCPNCTARIEARIYISSDPDAPPWLDEVPLPATFHHECHRCQDEWYGMPAIGFLMHPAVIAFHHQHDVDLRSTPIWRLPWAETNLERVANEDPLRLEIPYTLEGETLVLTVDRTATVRQERHE